mmetsp:Transcript_18150/g.30078  ORF Transcript_18150/g.30078 Transcript_18150/m.30078 type:complete len:533 (-) Transcript_18150:127-1725(-)
MEKLAARGETLEERDERRSQRRAARITAKFGYTPDENPFNDPNLHETFTWKKKDQTIITNSSASNDNKDGGGDSAKQQQPRQANQDHIFEEIEKVRKRRQDREMDFEERERIKAEESRMKELENYDDWARKEEEFHLNQQRQRSAIRLVEGREKPIDVLAKNLLMFGLTEEERENRAAVKYQERYNALNELETLEVEFQKPQDLLKDLKLEELKELSGDIDTFRRLEAEGGSAGRESTVLCFWDNLSMVVQDEIQFLKDGGEQGPHASTIEDIRKLFDGKSQAELRQMNRDVEDQVRKKAHAAAFDASLEKDTEYWKTVMDQLKVHMAKMELSELHNKMLVRQIERLEEKKAELDAAKARGETTEADTQDPTKEGESMAPKGVDPEFGNLEEELGLTDEVNLNNANYSWQDKFRPRKPRYFHRVKSGYDWNTYNKNHYDHDNPPPKIVQGYRFNVFYPDLIDKTKTPQFFLEKADTNEYCIIRFSAGPPYEDVAFKIINREWNRSRKHGFRSTFERGVLTLYFSFTTHWYRR